jgi:hypothetical protein
MASGNLDDDDYVASLLKQDARNAAKKYEMVGLDAFLPSRCVLALVPTSKCSS